MKKLLLFTIFLCCTTSYVYSKQYNTESNSCSILGRIIGGLTSFYFADQIEKKYKRKNPEWLEYKGKLKPQDRKTVTICLIGTTAFTFIGGHFGKKIGEIIDKC